jgi:hypothetical protein
MGEMARESNEFLVIADFVISAASVTFPFEFSRATHHAHTRSVFAVAIDRCGLPVSASGRGRCSN